MGSMTRSRFRVDGPPHKDDVAILRTLLRPQFLQEAGWDPVELILTPPRRHHLLGILECATVDCLGGIRSPGAELCRPCHLRHKASGLSLPDFLATPSGKTNRGDRLCLVNPCDRPAHQRSGLCSAHHYQFRGNGRSLTVPEWIATAQPKAMPSLGPCRVPSCPRVAAAQTGLCLAHAQQWNKVRRDDPPPDFARWTRSREPADTGRIVVFKDLPEQVIVEVLLGLQWRTDAEIQTRMTILRALVRLARQKRAQSIFDLLTGAMDISRGDLAALLRGMTLAVQRSLSSPELEQRRDRWDLTMFGGNGQINFTVLHQPWLREAAKHWAIEDLPLHRGRQATATAKQTIRAVGYLSWSLRHARADHGLDVRSLSRADVVAFTNRMAFLQRSGKISEYKRVFICRRVRRFLDDVRAFGLTRPDQVLAGLPDDFRLRPGDVPADAADDSPGRDLPVPVLRTINAELPLLEELSGVEVRRIIEILIDTGRRPDEICQLPWDCLGTTADGRDVLIYTDNKNNRPNRRLPIGGETAELIRSYRQDLLRRFPGTPLERLALFPRSYRNPRGDHHVKVDSLSRFHRKFIDLIAGKLRDDAGQPFPALAVVPYAYRHSYAQRHADNGPRRTCCVT